MNNYFLLNLSELAQKRAIIMREEAQLWDILSRDLKREAGRLKDASVKGSVRPSQPARPSDGMDGKNVGKAFVRVSEAMKMMSIGRSSLYNEINAGRIRVRKSGRKTLIAVDDIHAWFNHLPIGCM